MHLAGLILGWTLLGQMSDAAAAMPDRSSAATLVAQNDWSSSPGPAYGRRPAAGTGPGGASIRPPSLDAGSDSSSPGRTDRRRRPPEMVAEALRSPGGEISGKPLALLAAVSSGADRRQQFEIVLTYWRLAEAVADYHYCLNHAKTLDSLGPFGGTGFGGMRGDDAAMAAARADAAAQTQEAQLGLLRAQYELAALMRAAAGTPLPLPADRPHVGPYRTDFKAMFADRTPPEPARLADRILPVQWRQVDQQATAVQAAEDALAATQDDYRGGRGAAAVVACSRELLRQQRALMRAVCAYNRNIADYKFSVVGPAATPQELVGGLIITADTPPAARPPSGDARAVRPASAEEPLHPETFRRPPQGEPTLAPPRGELSGSADSDPRVPPAEPVPPDRVPLAKPVPPDAAPSDRLQPVSGGEPHLAPPLAPAGREPADIPETRVVPVEAQTPATDPFPRSTTPSSTARVPLAKPVPAGPAGPSLRTAGKLQGLDPLSSDDGGRGGAYPAGARGADAGLGARPDAAGARYAALVAASPAARTKQLTAGIYADLGAPAGAGKPISLIECLYRANSDRLSTIKAYWLLRQRQAQYRTLLDQKEMLAAIEQTVVGHRSDTTGAADMLRLQSARMATEAAISQAQVALIEAQYALALRIGTVAETAWPLASTAPHTGSYLLKQRLQPPGVIQSWPVQRLIATIPRLTDAIMGRASAVVEADSARTAAIDGYRSGRPGIDAVLAAIAGQTEETSALLTCVTEYNAAIAEYSLTVLQPGCPADKLAASLVMKP